jgi:hypothetical protein
METTVGTLGVTRAEHGISDPKVQSPSNAVAKSPSWKILTFAALARAKPGITNARAPINAACGVNMSFRLVPIGGATITNESAEEYDTEISIERDTSNALNAKTTCASPFVAGKVATPEESGRVHDGNPRHGVPAAPIPPSSDEGQSSILDAGCTRTRIGWESGWSATSNAAFSPSRIPLIPKVRGPTAVA